MQDFIDGLTQMWAVIEGFDIFGVSFKWWLIGFVIIGLLGMFTRGKRD